MVITPDGDMVTTAALPSGDLLAAWRPSGAASVVSASSEIPSGAAARALFPVARLVLRSGVVRRFGTVREGWLRLDDALDFTVAAAAEVAHRLAAGDGRPGASTPAVLFGTDLAADIGGHFIL